MVSEIHSQHTNNAGQKLKCIWDTGTIWQSGCIVKITRQIYC
jgi:hypothetical protein